MRCGDSDFEEEVVALWSEERVRGRRYRHSLIEITSQTTSAELSHVFRARTAASSIQTLSILLSSSGTLSNSGPGARDDAGA